MNAPDEIFAACAEQFSVQELIDQKTHGYEMSQDQIEDLAPEEYSLFLADGEFSSTAYRTTPHSMVMSDQCEIKAHITWV